MPSFTGVRPSTAADARQPRISCSSRSSPAARASAAVEGLTPVNEGIATCRAILDQVRGSPVAAAVTLHPIAALLAMRGDFDEARAAIREGNAILAELDRLQSAVSHHEALVELLASEPRAAAERLRSGYARLEGLGEQAVLATTAALLAQALYEAGEHREAEGFCSISEAAAAAEDRVTQATWRGVRAKLLARARRFEEAEALARESVRLLSLTDQLSRQGDAFVDLAEVLRRAGHPDADAALRDGVERYERKGNVVSAARARTLLAAAGAR